MPPTPKVHVITADDGTSTATLTITRNRQVQPYLWRPLPEDTATSRDPATWDDGNASMLEGSLLGTYYTIVLEGLSGDFRAEFWGEGFNHIGVSGFQIRSAQAPTLGLTIKEATAPGTGYNLEWESQAGELYNLLTSTSLDEPIADWELVEGDIVANPPANAFNVQTDGPLRFYAFEGFDAPPPPPPIFFENFDAVAALPDDWSSTGPSNGLAINDIETDGTNAS